MTCSASFLPWNRSLQQEGEVSLHRDFQGFPSSDITVLYLNRERLQHCAVGQCENPVLSGAQPRHRFCPRFRVMSPLERKKTAIKNRALPCPTDACPVWLESVVLVVSNSCSKARAGLPGRLAGLLPRLFLATALPRRTLFQRLVFCMIDHGLLPASPRAHHGPRSCLSVVERRPIGAATQKFGLRGSIQSSPVQSNPVHRVQMDHGGGGVGGRVAPCGLLIFGLLSCRVRLGTLCLGGQEFLHFAPTWLLDANCFLLCPDSDSSLVKNSRGSG